MIEVSWGYQKLKLNLFLRGIIVRIEYKGEQTIKTTLIFACFTTLM